MSDGVLTSVSFEVKRRLMSLVSEKMTKFSLNDKRRNNDKYLCHPERSGSEYFMEIEKKEKSLIFVMQFDEVSNKFQFALPRTSLNLCS